MPEQFFKPVKLCFLVIAPGGDDAGPADHGEYRDHEQVADGRQQVKELSVNGKLGGNQ